MIHYTKTAEKLYQKRLLQKYLTPKVGKPITVSKNKNSFNSAMSKSSLKINAVQFIFCKYPFSHQSQPVYRT